MRCPLWWTTDEPLGLEWWTNEQIYRWEMLRRGVEAGCESGDVLTSSRCTASTGGHTARAQIGARAAQRQYQRPSGHEQSLECVRFRIRCRAAGRHGTSHRTTRLTVRHVGGASDPVRSARVPAVRGSLTRTTPDRRSPLPWRTARVMTRETCGRCSGGVRDPRRARLERGLAICVDRMVDAWQSVRCMGSSLSMPSSWAAAMLAVPARLTDLVGRVRLARHPLWRGCRARRVWLMPRRLLR